jgi:hypothetical protein
MKYLRALVLICAWFAAPAPAQDDALGVYSDASAACLDRSAAPMTPEQKIAVCGAALTALDDVYARSLDPSSHETNVYRLQRVFAHVAIAGAYGTLDRVRSSRVCNEVESAWTELAQIVDRESPSDFQQAIANSRASVLGTTTRCRAEKGTPAGAAPLPSQPVQ